MKSPKKVPTLTVRVTSTFEIPITEADKKHILWDDKDLTKFAREIIGYGIFDAARNSHVIAQIKYEIQGKIAEVNREKKYVDMLCNSTNDYTIIKLPESKGKWWSERSSGYAGHRCGKCGTWIREHEPLICDCDRA